MVWRYMAVRMAAAKPVPVTRVVAAAGDIKLGSVLTAANLKTIEVSGNVAKGMILKPEDAIGRGVLSDLYDGEPIMENRLAAPGTGGGLASIIPKGMRACAVKVDDVVGVAGFVTPGMRVDVLASGTPPSAAAAGVQQTVTKTILQNIQVLSAGTDYQKDAGGKAKSVQVVNLMVTPEQAEALSLASNQEKIQLVLRNPMDTSIEKVRGEAMSSLFSDDTAPVTAKPVVTASRVVRKPAEQAYSIEIINGSKRSQQKFASPEEKQ